ncbi:MAG TPA: LysM peptidoglycan-binding domain-containing protein [Pyrinomonadaceae bacterium]|nr:LysM peptidoglycan-binding domain-containing protein [Pyrinomonadaceae bacterium]
MIRTVKSGDTLSRIAKENGLTLAQLLNANPQFKAKPNSIKVGDTVVIPENGSQPVQPVPASVPQPIPAQPQAAAASSELGKLSAKFETGNKGPGTVSTGAGDRGGVSYGSYQMSSKLGVVARFLAQLDPAFRNKFGNLKPGSAEFTSVWKQCAASQPAEFQACQHAFIKKTHFDPLAAKIKKEDGLDVTTRSHALQDVIWSTAVQHGGASRIPHVALATLGIDPSHPEFDKRFIVAIYAERGRRRGDGKLSHFSGNSLDVQKGVANRFRTEQTDALNMLANEA